MDYKLFCLCTILHLSIITSKKCGHIHLSVGATNNTVVMNWRMNCPNNQRKFVLTRGLTAIAWKNITSDREKVSHMETKIIWDYDKFPGNVYPNNTHPSNKPSLCFPYEMRSYRGGKLVDKQCLVANIRWMSMFKSFGNLRLGNMYIPGTHNSLSTRRRQRYDIWGQLIFGIRYFDFPIAAERNENGKLTFRTAYVKNPMQELFRNLIAFMKIAFKEVVILDFRGFHGFKGMKEHNLLIKIITKHLGKWMVKRKIWNHKYGPKLSELWKIDKRIIINYRHNPMVKKHDFLWNDILIQYGKKTTPKALRTHMDKTLKNTDYNEKMRVYVAVLHPGKYSDVRKLADRVNTELSNWYHFDKNLRHINIIAVDFFESSKIHIDAVWINKQLH